MDLSAPLLVGALVLVASIASVGAASGAESVAGSIRPGPRLTIDDPVLSDVLPVTSWAVGAGATIDGGASGSPSPDQAFVFTPVVVDPPPDDVTPAAHVPRALAAASPSPSPSASLAPRPTPRPTPKPAAPSFAPLLWPVPGGTLSQGFGCTGFAWEPAFGSCAHYHNGIDIAAPLGTPIVAAAAGTVAFAGWQSNGGGYQVWVSDGGGMYTGYHHMAYVSVHTGDRIRRGQRIGAVGMTGDATGPHCHFMVSIGPFWSGGQPVDPRRYL